MTNEQRTRIRNRILNWAQLLKEYRKNGEHQLEEQVTSWLFGVEMIMADLGEHDLQRAAAIPLQERLKDRP